MLEAKTGKIVWESYFVPKVEADPVRGPEGASPLDKSTWENAAGIPISGVRKDLNDEYQTSTTPLARSSQPRVSSKSAP